MIYMKSYKAFEAVYTNSNGGNFWGDIGAGILPICTTTKRILINHRSEDMNEPNTWGVWGGALDGGYSPEEGALKEFKEECGYDGDIKLIPAYIFQTKTKNFTYYNFLGLVETEFIPV